MGRRRWWATALASCCSVTLLSGCSTGERGGVATTGAEESRFAVGLDPARLYTDPPPDGWRPDVDLPLDAALPVPWPDQYVTLFRQPFAPYAFRTNAASICAHARAHPEDAPAAAVLAERLFDRMVEYTTLVDDARFVQYRFAYQYEDLALASGWVSGLGNAEAIMGTLAIDQCWPDPRRLDTARELAAAFRVTDTSGPWFARLLPDGHVWFEEIAVEAGPVMVLNGHLEATIALYTLWEADRRDDALADLIEDAMAAVVDHIDDYRRPGQALCYDLTPSCHDDYGPERTIDQIDVLYQISGDERFRAMRDLLAADVGLDPSTFVPVPRRPIATPVAAVTAAGAAFSPP
jgi:hypothetical protein